MLLFMYLFIFLGVVFRWQKTKNRREWTSGGRAIDGWAEEGAGALPQTEKVQPAAGSTLCSTPYWAFPQLCLRLSPSQGWLQDRGGNWVKDDNVEFDSDEEDPPALCAEDASPWVPPRVRKHRFYLYHSGTLLESRFLISTF